jgi:enoyl-CoA hydratase
MMNGVHFNRFSVTDGGFPRSCAGAHRGLDRAARAANPPVNAFGHALRQALYDRLCALRRTSGLRAIVLVGSGRGFSAGGDTRELGTSASSQAPGLSSHVHAAIEGSDVPVIAAVHGFAIGGGLETALACHYRIAHADARLALPETGLGILPLSGTQRLPRALGFEATLELIVSGRRLHAGALAGGALFDRLLDPGTDVESAAIAFAREIAVRKRHPLIRERPPLEPVTDEQLDAVRAQHAHACAAVRAAVEAIAAAYRSRSFDAGLDRARALYDMLERDVSRTAP